MITLSIKAYDQTLHAFQLAMDWKSKSILELVSILEKLVSGQYSDIRGALLGTGEFRQFQSTKTEWVSKTNAKKTKTVQEV